MCCPLSFNRRLLFNAEQASKYLRNILSDRGVWTKILREICIKESLFEPSYPVDDMTLQEIQRAALAPSRWRRRIASNIIRTDLDTFYESIQPFHDCLEDPIAPTEFFGRAFLIPGGRYLVSIPRDHNIEIYDLGVSGRPLSTARSPITRTEDQGEPWPPQFMVAPLGDTKVRVALLSKGDDWRYVLISLLVRAPTSSLDCRLEVYDFSWASGAPVLDTRYSIELVDGRSRQNPEIWRPECHEHLIMLFSSRGTVVVLDARDGMYDVWETDPDLLGSNPPMISAYTEQFVQRVGQS